MKQKNDVIINLRKNPFLKDWVFAVLTLTVMR